MTGSQIDELFGRAVADRRRALGLSAAAVAKLVQCSRPTITLIEHGHAPSLRLACRLAAALGFSIDEINGATAE